jgi:hypothetical protein
MKLASLISSLTPSAQDVRDLDDLLSTMEAAPRRLQVLRQVLSNPDNTRQFNELLGALATDPPKRIPPVRAFLALAAAESEPAAPQAPESKPAPQTAPQAPESSKPQAPWRAPEGSSSSAPAAPATPESAPATPATPESAPATPATPEGCGGTGIKGESPCPLCGGRPDTNPACRPG